MGAADRKASELAKACAGAVSTFVLHGREGEEFAATVLQIEPDRDRATVILHEPPVRAHCDPNGLRRGIGDHGPAAVRGPGQPHLRGGAGAGESRARPSGEMARCTHGRRNRPEHGLLLQHQHQAGRAGGQSKAKDLLGPFPTEEEAANALETIREREERKEAEDREWRDR